MAEYSPVKSNWCRKTRYLKGYCGKHFEQSNGLYIQLYWLLRLYRRPAAEDYLLCHIGTLALRVHVVMPGRPHQTFIAVIRSIVS